MVAAGGLKEAVGAQYTTSEGESTNEVGADGKFTLQNGETVTFADQFRRGSYISLHVDFKRFIRLYASIASHMGKHPRPVQNASYRGRNRRYPPTNLPTRRLKGLHLWYVRT